MVSTPTPKRPRIDVADVLRSISILGIVLLHCVEHYRFTGAIDVESSIPFFRALDSAVWEGIHFIFSSKSYAIFSLLFGFSFYIQERNERERGGEFRLRFCWRLVILFIFGVINNIFYPADILVIYSIVGFILPAVVRLSDKWLAIIATLLLAQPQMIFHLVKTSLGGEFTPFIQLGDPTFIPHSDELQHTSDFLSTALWHLKGGEQSMIGWSLSQGRINLTAALFIAGLLVGRRSLFAKESVTWWIKVGALALVAYLPLKGLCEMLPGYITNQQSLSLTTTLLTSWTNLSLATMLTAAIIVTFYTTRLKGAMMQLVPFGKMSLTNYLTQSIIGSFIFFGWGLGLAFKIGSAASLLVGVAIFSIQLIVSRWWLARHKQGPLEDLWRRITWIGRSSSR